MRLIIIMLALLAPVAAAAQSAILQGGPWAQGHAPMYSGPSGGGQPVVQDSGPAGGGGYGAGLSEILQTNRGAGSPPYSNSGSGPYSTHFCLNDGPITSAYHYMCFDANAQGGALIAVGYGGGASPLPLSFILNGITYSFPFSGGGAGGDGVTFTTSYTVATLPVCSSGTQRILLMVGDGVTSPGYRSSYAGGGASDRLVFCDGVAWTYN